MSKKMTVLLVAVLLFNTGLAAVALYVANLSQPADYSDAGGLNAQGAGDLTQVAGVEIDAEQGDIVVPIKAMQRGGNFRIDFTAGKATSFGREEHEGTWDELAGAVVYRPQSQELVAIEVTFAVTSLTTDATPLTNTVLAKEKWFDYENHPTAVFTCDSIAGQAIADDQTQGTHLLQGQFTLNGITKDMPIVATLAFTGQALTLEADFTILRSDFGVEKREGSIAGSVGGVVSDVDDAVQLHVRLTASPDATAVIAELAAAVNEQSEQLAQMQSLLQQTETRLRTVEAWESRLGSSAGQAVDVSQLPDRFTDYAPEYNQVKPDDGEVYVEIKRYAPFEMIRVPGDDEAGIATFYMSKLEVTWAMFEAWSYCRDIVDPHEAEHLIKELGLRPSPLYGDPMVIVQIDQPGNPTRAVSRLTAEDFCKWLTEMTGRRYRLPTESEWEHALMAGGGMPSNLDAAAWYFDNAPRDDFFGDPVNNPEDIKTVPPAGTKEPNALGIHDMLGSVSEWVVPDRNPAERALRGGNMQTRLADLTFDWRDVEDPIAWHELYPQAHSRFWYPSYQFGGIRLVCEAQSVQDNPPTGRAPQE